MVIAVVAQAVGGQGWTGSPADAADGGMVDDARFLLSPVLAGGQEPAALTLAFAAAGEDPGGPLELVVRTQRMVQGRASGTGTPAALTLVLHSGEHQLLEETVTPGGSWREDRYRLPRAALGPWEELRVSLLVPAGDRQVAISRLVLEPAEWDDAEQPVEDGSSLAGCPNPGVAEPPCPLPVVGAAEPPVEPSPAPAAAATKAKRRRARGAKGRLLGDDPSTPEVNKAWQD